MAAILWDFGSILIPILSTFFVLFVYFFARTRSSRSKERNVEKDLTVRRTRVMLGDQADSSTGDFKIVRLPWDQITVDEERRLGTEACKTPIPDEFPTLEHERPRRAEKELPPSDSTAVTWRPTAAEPPAPASTIHLPKSPRSDNRTESRAIPFSIKLGRVLSAIRPFNVWLNADAREAIEEKNSGGDIFANPPMSAGIVQSTSQVGTDEHRDPPRSSYGLIDCADTVVSGVEFEVVIGLSETKIARVVGNALVRPTTAVGPYEIDLYVIADGFQPRDDESLFHTLSVTAKNPYPTITLHLHATPPAGAAIERQIRVRYVIDDQVVGIAARPVMVERFETTQHPKFLSKRYRNFAIPTGPVPPDLTLYILKMEGNRIGWSFHSPHGGIEEPAEPISVPMEQAESFARMLIDDMRVEEGKATLFKNVRGQGKRIAEKIPIEVLDAIQVAATKAAPRPPMIFLITDEAYVPWELAVIKPFFNDVPPFLAAQATVGRWILTTLDLGTPAPIDIRMEQMAVIAGDYKTPNFRKLPSAVDEAQDLQNAYGAVPVDATTDKVLSCIDGIPRAEVLHFAVHGVYDTTTTLRGLIMIDGNPITPATILGSDLTSTHPFVFLNACQVGTGEAVLGDYAGMAAAFIGAGAAGVIAPLWSVKDAIAREIAVSFYRESFQSQRTAAEVLRDERRKFGKAVDGEVPSSTYLAYQFFGHPQLMLHRENSQP